MTYMKRWERGIKMRKLFSEYGMFAIALVCGIISIAMFASVVFSKDANSLNAMLQNWIDHLV